jgi:hypothetical protein
LISSPRCAPNLLANTAKEFFAFGRRRGPNRLKVRRRAPADLYVCVHAAAVHVRVKVKEWLMPQVEVWAVVVTTRHVHKPID